MKTKWMGLGLVIGLISVTAGGQVQPGFHAGPLTLSPFAGVAGSYDSNTGRTSSDEDDDFFVESDLGLRLDCGIREVQISGMGFVVQRTYADQDDLDFWAGGETLKLQVGNPDKITLEAQESWRRVEDLDSYGSVADIGGMSPDAFLDADVRSRREILEAGTVLTAQLTDKSDVSAGYRYNQTDYSSDNLFDLSGHGAQLEAAHRVTEKTAGMLTLVGGLQESDDVDGEAEYFAARLGVRTRGTDRMSLKAGAGFQQLDRPEDGGTDDGFNFDAVATWAATDKTSVELEGRNGIQMSSIHLANIVDFSVFRLGVAYRMTPSIGLSASGVYRIDDYADPVMNEGELVDREDEGVTLKLRADYLIPAKYLRFFGELMYETVDSTIRDYDVSRVNLGVDIGY